jgi:hypothetical protein
MVAQVNQIQQLTYQLSLSPDSRSTTSQLGFPEGSTVSMESNDGYIDEGQVIFNIDEHDMDLLDGAELDDDETV